MRKSFKRIKDKSYIVCHLTETLMSLSIIDWSFGRRFTLNNDITKKILSYKENTKTDPNIT